MKKQLPSTNTTQGADYRRLFALPYEATRWELLKTALELKVFDCLAEPKSAQSVAAELRTDANNTEHLLNALVALGCLTKSDSHFSNTRLADTFLTTGRDTSIGHSLLYAGGWIAPVLNGTMLKLVRNGPPPTEDISSDAVWESGARCSLNLSRCGRAQMVAEQVTSLPEFGRFRRMLDLGAGPGIIGIAVASRHPSLQCCLLDQPAVCGVAEEVIAEYGMQDRVWTMSGDYVGDPIGDGYDFVMANYTLNFYRDRLNHIFGKVYEALNPCGVFMVMSDGLRHEKTQPAASVLNWLPMALQGMDMAFEQGEIADAMLAAGFTSTQTQTLPDTELEPHGPIDVVIGRKAGGMEPATGRNHA